LGVKRLLNQHGFEISTNVPTFADLIASYWTSN